MDVVRPPDARTFLALAEPLLGLDEPRHNLILGIAGTLLGHPDAYRAVHLWVVVDDGRVVAAALQTEPYNLVLAEPQDGEALDALLEAVHLDGTPIPGIVANVPYAEEAARRWTVLTGSDWVATLSQGVFALTTVRDVPRPPGRPRAATHDDFELLLEWQTAFAVEALPRPDEDLEGVERAIERRLSGTDAGMWLWETNGEPVSLAGYGMPTLTGIRVGPVYTPVEHRRRGYATALVAGLSRSLIAQGRRACFLYTDLSNPTSNAIYERIGYERVADATEIRFRDP